MTLTEWLVLAAGLALGYAVVSMLMGQRRKRPAAPIPPAVPPRAPPPPDPPPDPGAPRP
jgi:hypothetical protein